MYLDGVDELSVDVECGHAVLQHAFAHHQHQVVPLALSDQLSAAEASAAGQDLVEGGFFTRLIGCFKVGKEREERWVSQRVWVEVKTQTLDQFS